MQLVTVTSVVIAALAVTVVIGAVKVEQTPAEQLVTVVLTVES